MVPLAGVFLTKPAASAAMVAVVGTTYCGFSVAQCGVGHAALEDLLEVADPHVGDAARRGLAARHHARVPVLAEQAPGAFGHGTVVL